jgi:DNA-binding transcriptional ArsR family regulator
MGADPKRLRFPCECVSSATGGYSDPWAEVAKHKLLPDGTKEDIINLVAREPRTMSQLAEALKLSVPSVHAHVNDMMRSQLLRESEEWEKRYPTERYYEPNFPVFKAEDCAELIELCHEVAGKMASLFEKKGAQMKRAFNRTALAEKGWTFADITQCVFANAQRNARTLLEERGILKQPQKRPNGLRWVFWAQEPMSD